MSHIERIVFYTLHCPAAWATSRSYTTVPPAPSKAPNTSQVHLKYSWMSRRDQVALSHPALWNHRLLPKAWLYILICLRSSVSLPARLRSPGGGGGGGEGGDTSLSDSLALCHCPHHSHLPSSTPVVFPASPQANTHPSSHFPRQSSVFNNFY